jgi:DNA-binding CsgD family transcriptional regulator
MASQRVPAGSLAGARAIFGEVSPDGRALAHQAPLRAAAETMLATRGRARQAGRVFASSAIPMVIVDNDRRYLAANRGARLLFRLSQDQLRRRQIEDFTAPEALAELEDRWHELMTHGALASDYDVRFPDGSRLTIVYCALANLLPGRHLIVFAPANWPEDELGPLEDGSTSPLPGPLSPREREVLSLVAAGADLQQVADELTISLATVRTHLGNVHRKLGARNRPHAVALAMQQGLLGGQSASGCDDASSF